jgi:hypothetical protein
MIAEVIKSSADPEECQSRDVLLRASGYVFDSSIPVGHSGLSSVLWNYPMNGKLWKFRTTCSKIQSNDFAFADERGQVFACYLKENLYKSVRLASSPVTCMCFVDARRCDLVVAYESGTILVVDCESRDVVGNINLTTLYSSSNLSEENVSARILRSHPTKPIIMIASDGGLISMWDLQ